MRAVPAAQEARGAIGRGRRGTPSPLPRPPFFLPASRLLLGRATGAVERARRVLTPTRVCKMCGACVCVNTALSAPVFRLAFAAGRGARAARARGPGSCLGRRRGGQAARARGQALRRAKAERSDCTTAYSVRAKQSNEVKAPPGPFAMARTLNLKVATFSNGALSAVSGQPPGLSIHLQYNVYNDSIVAVLEHPQPHGRRAQQFLRSLYRLGRHQPHVVIRPHETSLRHALRAHVPQRHVVQRHPRRAERGAPPRAARAGCWRQPLRPPRGVARALLRVKRPAGGGVGGGGRG